MSTADTWVSVLTPPGSGAIATVEVSGTRAWEFARQAFRPASKKPLPELPPLYRFWFGTLGDETGDAVVLAVRQTEAEPRIEVHCHGGRKIVNWVVGQFVQRGCIETVGRAELDAATAVGPGLIDLLSHAATLRTASILLDQFHGAFDRAVHDILTILESGEPARAAASLEELTRFAPIGRHLIEPWKVVIAGAPNVGKSSLVNALAGYQRTVVSRFAGTTRDVVTVPLAFDGWPVELSDTAGLRDAVGLEGEGIVRTARAVSWADLVVWVMDATADRPATGPPASITVVNKIDRPAGWNLDHFPDMFRVSALTGEGIPGLAATIARKLVPDPLPPGAAVPYAPELIDRIETARAAAEIGQVDEAVRYLRACLEAR